MHTHINLTQKKKTRRKIDNNNNIKKKKKIRKKYKSCAICTVTKRVKCKKNTKENNYIVINL